MGARIGRTGLCSILGNSQSQRQLKRMGWQVGLSRLVYYRLVFGVNAIIGMVLLVLCWYCANCG